MDRQETLRDVFDGVARDPDTRALFREDPDGFLADHGFGDVPPDLLPEAVVHYADVTPLEVAEQLSPFVMAHSPVEPDVPLPEPGDPLAALADVAWEPADAADAVDVDGTPTGDDVEDTVGGEHDLDDLDDLDLAFGAGHEGEAPVNETEAPASDEVSEGLDDGGPSSLATTDLGADPLDLDELTIESIVPVVEEIEEPEAPEDAWDDVI